LKAARSAWLDEAAGLERAKRERSDFLAYVDSSGRFADFHALRHSFISLITQGGVHPKLAQRLAGHSDINLTMSRYSHTLPADEAQALGVLPSLPSAFGATHNQQQVLAATGTGDVTPRGRSVLPMGLPKPDAEPCILAHSLAQSEQAKTDAEVSDQKHHNRLETPAVAEYDLPDDHARRER
jgi:hypothetical protein